MNPISDLTSLFKYYKDSFLSLIVQSLRIVVSLTVLFSVAGRDPSVLASFGLSSFHGAIFGLVSVGPVSRYRVLLLTNVSKSRLSTVNGGLFFNSAVLNIAVLIVLSILNISFDYIVFNIVWLFFHSSSFLEYFAGRNSWQTKLKMLDMVLFLALTSVGNFYSIHLMIAAAPISAVLARFVLTKNYIKFSYILSVKYKRFKESIGLVGANIFQTLFSAVTASSIGSYGMIPMNQYYASFKFGGPIQLVASQLAVGDQKKKGGLWLYALLVSVYLLVVIFLYYYVGNERFQGLGDDYVMTILVFVHLIFQGANMIESSAKISRSSWKSVSRTGIVYMLGLPIIAMLGWGTLSLYWLLVVVAVTSLLENLILRLVK